MWTAQKSLKLSATESRTEFAAVDDLGMVFPEGCLEIGVLSQWGPRMQHRYQGALSYWHRTHSKLVS